MNWCVIFRSQESWLMRGQKATQTAAILTSTLLKHHVAPKLETILDRETKITHEMLSATIEARMGSGEGENAKGPDMKVWKNSKELNDVRFSPFYRNSITHGASRSIGESLSFHILPLSSPVLRRKATTSDTQQSPRMITFRIRECYLLHSECVTRPTARIWPGRSS